jgi:hypothetical protein
MADVIERSLCQATASAMRMARSNSPFCSGSASGQSTYAQHQHDVRVPLAKTP